MSLDGFSSSRRSHYYFSSVSQQQQKRLVHKNGVNAATLPSGKVSSTSEYKVALMCSACLYVVLCVVCLTAYNKSVTTRVLVSRVESIRLIDFASTHSNRLKTFSAFLLLVPHELAGSGRGAFYGRFSSASEFIAKRRSRAAL